MSSSDLPQIVANVSATVMDNLSSSDMPSNHNQTSPSVETSTEPFWLQTLLQLVPFSVLAVLAMLSIYIGAHGGLKRPVSAAPEVQKKKKAEKKNKKKKKKKDDNDFVEVISTADILLIPLLSSVVLVGLYYILQYLKDPTLVSRILSAYVSVAALYHLNKLFPDALGVARSLLFPRVVAYRGGLYHVQPLQCRWVPVGNTATAANAEALTTPFPPALSWLATSPAVSRYAWSLRKLLAKRWSASAWFPRSEKLKAKNISVLHLISVVLTLGTLTFYWFGHGLQQSRVWNNVICLSLCYSGLQLIVPADFFVASAVLVALFVYDIVMVFYTPFMVTVATKIEAPLAFSATTPIPKAKHSAMLGLGDVVLPGIFLCMCLRFDLHQFYVRKIKQVPTVLKTETASNENGDAAVANTTTTITSETKTLAVKAPYVDPRGRWGDRLWSGRTGGTASTTTAGLAAAAFPKPCFHAGMVGYVIGATSAATAATVTRSGQPALLYLVPAVLLASWGWAWSAGELSAMWAYSEDPSKDVKDVVVEVGADGKPLEKKEENNKVVEKKATDQATDKTSDKTSDTTEKKAKRGLLSFSFKVSAKPDSDEDDF